ncbi:MAG TPA: Sec-independent protein translocase protein TatB [Brevundimonas sp.]
MGPGIGGSEWFIIGLVALLVVGPERLPGLLRQLGKMVAKARGMANEFRASFDEMARQSELDELRKEVEALRTVQSPVRLGADADAAFKGIKDEFDKPLFAAATPASGAPVVPESVAEPVMTPTASEWPDGEPVMMPLATPSLTEPEAEPVVAATPVKRAAPRKSAANASLTKATTPKTSVSKVPGANALAKTGTAAAAKSGTATKTTAKARAPRNSKLDL